MLDSYTKNCINIRDEGGDKLEDQLHSRERERPFGTSYDFFKDIMASIN